MTNLTIDCQATYDLMRRHGIRPTHSLGQNFLLDEAVLQAIVDSADLDSQDLVLEIGPGLGHLTRLMADRAARIVAIEIDRHLLPALHEMTDAAGNIEIIHADARNVRFSTLREKGSGSHKIVANLPYYITTPLIIKCLSEWPSAERLVLTIQNEAAERILAGPGQGNYGPLAVLCQLYGQPIKQRIIHADAFVPRPNVDSCLLVIRGNPDRPPEEEWPSFARFLNGAFANRRKKLSNVLLGQPVAGRSKEDLAAVFEQLGLSSNARAEELPPIVWYRLFKSLN